MSMNYTMCLGDVIWQRSRIVPVLKPLERMYEQGVTRRALAEEVSVSTRYLANIELGLIIPSVPVMLRLIQICHLPMERYFNPTLMQENSEVRQRVRHKMQLCPEKYLPIVEATLDGAIRMKE